MAERTPTRDEALALLTQYNQSDRALKHALAVEAVMRHLAAKAGADADEWGLVGLIHDLDYEQFPDAHCAKTAELLAQADWPDRLIRAAVSHGWGICCDVEPVTDIERTLYAIDELTGLVAAAALVRPSRSVLDLSAKSVRKKWNQKRFAAGVDRSIIEKGAAMLGVELSDLITDVIAAMRTIADDLALTGQQPDADGTQ